ncbi:M10 family metallopeptidase C-terminal domain-containing protein [bacterium]|nr:M10 family metallopeptidase C-terminal domain-containing protein [bacterium]
MATANAPWQLGIQDVAALQHLYGANLNTNADDTTYTYSSDNQVWDTIWDGGGHDTIVHEGRFDAYIDLNEGAVSHLGFHGGTSFTYTASDFGTGRAFNASNSGFSESSDGLVKVAADGSTLTYWLNQGPNGIDDSYRLNVEFIDGDSFFVEITSLSAIDTSFITGNVGIAYGVTIEDAIGGDGDDVLIGNRAANTLRGGLGDDSYTGGGNADTFLIEADFGMDEILDFEKGLDQLVFSGFASADVSVAESAGDTVFTDTFGNSVTVAGVTDLVFATDYNYVVV